MGNAKKLTLLSTVLLMLLSFQNCTGNSGLSALTQSIGMSSQSSQSPTMKASVQATSSILPDISIRQSYLKYFGREPAAEEIAAWRGIADQSAIDQGLNDWLQVTSGLGNGEYAATVARSYQVTFGRGPGDVELANWLQASPRPPFYILLRQMNQWLHDSPDAVGEVDQVITRAYLAAEGRAPLAGELASWRPARPGFTFLRDFVASYFDNYRGVKYSSCIQYLTNARTGLVTGFTNPERNTLALQKAIDCLPASGDLYLPPGIFAMKTVDVKNKNKFQFRAGGAQVTRLVRSGFEWDNTVSGDSQEYTELLRISESKNLTLSGLSFDGDSMDIAVRGYGDFNVDRTIKSGTPQFPKYANANSGTILSVSLSENIEINSSHFLNGFGWAVMIGQVKGFNFSRNWIDTGNIDTDYRGHLNPWGHVMHVHSSQDGLHMLNVLNGTIAYNTIFSEDSGIAVEAVPAWNWWKFSDGAINTQTANIDIHNNFVSTARGSRVGRNAWTAPVYGDMLVAEFQGQGGVDIFYNETEDPHSDYRGANARIQNISVRQNALSGNRYGVRAGYFLGAGFYDAQSAMHEINGLTITENNANFTAGHLEQALAGINNISNSIPETSQFGSSGGVGILMRSVSRSYVADNVIDNIVGGIGIELVGSWNFSLFSNQISHIQGTSLSSTFRWDGGEAIRVWNGSSLNAQDSAIWNNSISNTAGDPIFIFNTTNIRH